MSYKLYTLFIVLLRLLHAKGHERSVTLMAFEARDSCCLKTMIDVQFFYNVKIVFIGKYDTFQIHSFY